MVDQVTCTNPACERAGAPVDNPFGYPLDEIVCGVCGTPAGPYTAAEPQPREAP